MHGKLQQAIATAEAYLAAMEARDMDAARSHVQDGPLDLTFPGARRFTGIDQIVANSGGRYIRVGKTIQRRSAWEEDGQVMVLIAGELNGVWRDGEAFDGIRFIDLFALRDGLIVRQEVWNDAGEYQLARKAEENQS
ncbi:nuclear transport factor 2 family protein [Oceanibium sediminis]|uniref:nuclear transport factor 2 family protein n=1 Tax=Oceanibium sediminis TaxID=2026339 RepID=UPI000DD2F996|nr:nuclear transport factor 2 family protein [Oceanibium sediminis]